MKLAEIKRGMFLICKTVQLWQNIEPIILRSFSKILKWKMCLALQYVHFQVFATRMTSNHQNLALFKSYFSAKNRLAAFHSYIDQESVFALEKSMGVWWPCFIFVLLPTNGSFQPTVANWRLFNHRIFNARLASYRCCESKLSQYKFSR